jgi:hypothetical protein
MRAALSADMTISLPEDDSVVQVLPKESSDDRVGFWEWGAVSYVNKYQIEQFIPKVPDMSHMHSEQGMLRFAAGLTGWDWTATIWLGSPVYSRPRWRGAIFPTRSRVEGECF